MAEILVVEDDEAIADLVCLNLNREGYHCSCARDGMEGIRLIGEGTYDLVLLDIMLPIMDGWSVLKKIREGDKTPVIMLTAKGETEDKVSGLEQGADDYIVKPFSGGEVMTMDMEYLLAAAKELKKQDVTLTIDTCGHVPYEKFQAILPYVDTFLYDIKVMDSQLHKQYMGVDNKLILENLVRLARDGARIYIRIPVIKEVNGNEKNMKETIAFLKEHDIHPPQINLLPYHDTGSGKYPKLDMEYKGTDLHAPERAEMEEFVRLFQEAGFQNTKIGG